MRKRSTEILCRLLDAPQHTLLLRNLLDDYGVSDKTLRSDIKTITQFIQDKNEKTLITICEGHMHLVDDVDEDAIRTKLSSMDLYSYRLSQDERRAYIVVMLLQHNGEPTCMQDIAESMYVTRNTVLSDCKLVKTYLEKNNVPLIIQNKIGISIDVDRQQRQDLLIDIFDRAISDRRHQKDFFTHLLGEMLGYRYEIDEVFDLMHSFERQKDITVADDSECEIACCIYVMLNEGTPNKENHPGPVQWLDVMDEMVRFIVNGLDVTPDLEEDDIAGIEHILEQRHLFNETRRVDDKNLRRTARRFLCQVGASMDLNLQDDEQLNEAIRAQLKSVLVHEWDPDKFDLNISRSSSNLIDTVSSAAGPQFHVLEEELCCKLDPSARSAIMLEICAACVRTTKAFSSLNVVVVTSSSPAITDYLVSQIQSCFNFKIVECGLVDDLDDDELSRRNVDLVISTVQPRTIEKPVIVVAPILELQDIERLMAQAFQLCQAKGTLFGGQEG